MMFLYLALLLLVNSVFHSLGAPTSKNETNGIVVANSISLLADSCENSFISSEIKSKINDCEIIVPPYKKKQILCLMFYDINNQLCHALSTSKLTLKDKDENYTTKLNELQDVNAVCEITTDWRFTNITEYPKYKDTIEKVIKRPSSCVRICGSDEIDSEDTNYYCKYFKWGTEMLNQQVTTIEINGNKSVVPPPFPVDTLVSNEKNPEIPKKPETSILNTNETDVQTHNSAEQEAKPESAEDKTTPAKSEEPVKIVDVNPTQTANRQSQAIVNTGNPEKSDNLSNNIKVEKVAQQLQIIPNAVPSSNEVNKVSAEDIPINKEVSKEDHLLPNQISEQKDVVLENPEDYQGDSEESKDGIVDQGDDGDDPMSDNFDIKPDLEQTKNSKKSESFMSFNGEIPQREYYPNTIPDGYSTDDDHFFSFFLTAVILVVLLYILYHNKNKVSKVFFGLIVEGRQPGRRRNSRGHAYRRLDTLEQAMSTNTAAPPSKIIY